jgi:Polyketide cyclase / dehydrase and lipid transport
VGATYDDPPPLPLCTPAELMRAQQFAVSRHCRADAATVLSLLDDVDGWSTWARPVAMQTSWERWGDPAPAGAGAVRKLGAWPIWIRELILTREANGQTYTAVSPNLFSRYLGTVTVTAVSTGGVDIDWGLDFVARRQFMAPVLRVALKAIITALVSRLTVAAEK